VLWGSEKRVDIKKDKSIKNKNKEVKKKKRKKKK